MRASTFNSVAEHIEGYLGEISAGWSDTTSSHGIQVVSFRDQPMPSVTTYVTLGLSEVELALPRDRKIRQEIVVSAHDSFSGNDIAGFLLSLAEHIKVRGRAVLRGEVVGPWHPILKGATVNSVYVTNPTPFDDGFAEFYRVEPPVIFALLIPITEKEVSLVSNQGWNWFEEMLESQDPDIWDLNRVEQISMQSKGSSSH
jgi:hypothetical protein